MKIINKYGKKNIQVLSRYEIFDKVFKTYVDFKEKDIPLPDTIEEFVNLYHFNFSWTHDLSYLPQAVTTACALIGKEINTRLNNYNGTNKVSKPYVCSITPKEDVVFYSEASCKIKNGRVTKDFDKRRKEVKNAIALLETNSVDSIENEEDKKEVKQALLEELDDIKNKSTIIYFCAVVKFYPKKEKKTEKLE